MQLEVQGNPGDLLHQESMLNPNAWIFFTLGQKESHATNITIYS
jgi:hypothetical protein